MSGGGSIQNMRTTLGNNKDLLRKKKNPFKKKWGYASLRDQYRANEGTSEFRKASPEERAAIKAKMLRERKTVKKLILILIVSLLFATGAITWFVLQPDPILETPKELSNQSSELTTEADNTRQYTYFMNAGDVWMEEQNWYNAAFEYKKAIEIYPHIDAYQRLVLAYLYECRQSGEACTESLELINQLITSKPERADFYEIRAMYFLNQGDSAAAALDFQRADQYTE